MMYPEKEPTFEWDEAKANSNLEKHKVDFNEASTVFFDDDAFIDYDLAHSANEERFCIIGTSGFGRILIVIYTRRGNDHARLISARRANKKEKKNMEKIPEFDFSKARRMTAEEKRFFRRAFKNTFGYLPPRRKSHALKAKNQYKDIHLKIHLSVLEWAKRNAKKRGVKYQTVINESLLRLVTLPRA